MNTLIPKILLLLSLQSVFLLAQNTPSSSYPQENKGSTLQKPTIVIKPSQSFGKVKIINPNETEVKEVKPPSQPAQATLCDSQHSTTAPLSHLPNVSASHTKVETENDYPDDEDEDDFDEDHDAEEDEDNENDDQEDLVDDDSDDDWDDADDDDVESH